MPWFDLTVWSAWASLAGLVLSFWVLIQTFRVEKAVRWTEHTIYRRARLPEWIKKVETVRWDIHTLSGESDFDVREAQGVLGHLDALLCQLHRIPNPDIRTCLNKIDKQRNRRFLFWTTKYEVTLDRLLAIHGRLVELRDHLEEYQSQVDFLGRRQ